MSEHTPGPWTVDSPTAGILRGLHCLNAGEEVIAEAIHGDANALLLHAAPDLLRAAQSALSDLKWAGDVVKADFRATVLLLESAIEKAGGRT